MTMWLTAVPDNLQVLSVEDGSVTWLASGMLTAEDGISTISADQQLILDAVDVQVVCSAVPVTLILKLNRFQILILYRYRNDCCKNLLKLVQK